HHTCPCTFREAYKMVSSLLTPFLFPPPHTLDAPRVSYTLNCVNLAVLALFSTIWHQISVSIIILSRKWHG
ncbi:MAG TPA: hypothetical protein VEP90_00295, partial [Methylomirabilota bacterium]|nr:hypothetical protein [Methylomirabilota bacterium]